MGLDTIIYVERKNKKANPSCAVITQHLDDMIVRNMCWLGNSLSIQWQQRSFENKWLSIGWCAHQSSMSPSLTDTVTFNSIHFLFLLSHQTSSVFIVSK